MPDKCCAINCNEIRKLDKGIHLYRLHIHPVRRNLCIHAIKKSEVVGGKATNKQWVRSKYHGLCSKHLVSRRIVITNYSLHHCILVLENQFDGFQDNTMYYLPNDLTHLRQADKMPQSPTVYTKLRGATFLL